MDVEKPGKRVMLYWFVEYGFFFLVVSFFVAGTILKYVTDYYALTLVMLELSLVFLIFSVFFLLYEWLSTEYYLLNNHLFIKKAGIAEKIPYKHIKTVRAEATLLQHLLGTTNLVIEMKNNKNYYLRGVKKYS